jgi:hypothetical protein
MAAPETGRLSGVPVIRTVKSFSQMNLISKNECLEKLMFEPRYLCKSHEVAPVLAHSAFS